MPLSGPIASSICSTNGFGIFGNSISVTRRGTALDVETTSFRLSQVQAEMDELEEQLLDETDVASPRSPAFAGRLEAHGVTFGTDERTESGRGSLSKDVLPVPIARYRDDPVLGPILVNKARLAGLENRRSNLRQFLAMADPDGRVHPEFKTVQAVTGRMSIVRPALQTLRKGDAELRTCFMAIPARSSSRPTSTRSRSGLRPPCQTTRPFSK